MFNLFSVGRWKKRYPLHLRNDSATYFRDNREDPAVKIIDALSDDSLPKNRLGFNILFSKDIAKKIKITAIAEILNQLHQETSRRCCVGSAVSAALTSTV